MGDDMVGKMSNSKWNKVFEKLTMYDVTIKTTRFADEKIICPAEVCDECLFAFNYPKNQISYKNILYIKIDCPPEKASVRYCQGGN